MQPLLIEGAGVQVIKTTKVAISDIIAFCYGQDIILHRVIRRLKTASGEKFLQTKADNGHSLDIPVAYKDILGKAVAFRIDNKYKRLDDFLGRLKAYNIWFFSSCKALCRKYGLL